MATMIRAALIASLLLWAAPVHAQIVQFKEGVLNTASVTMNTALTTGNSVLVIYRTGDPGYAAPSSVTDPSNTYTSAGSCVPATSNNPVLCAFYKTNVVGGQTVITQTGGTGDYHYLFVIEIASTYPVFGSYVTNTGTGVTDIVSSAITTSRAGILITFVSQNNFAAYTAGADYTLIDGGIVGAGGAEYYVAPAVSSYVSHITSDVTNNYAALTVSFLTAAGGGASLMLTGVGR